MNPGKDARQIHGRDRRAEEAVVDDEPGQHKQRKLHAGPSMFPVEKATEQRDAQEIEGSRAGPRTGLADDGKGKASGCDRMRRRVKKAPGTVVPSTLRAVPGFKKGSGTVVRSTLRAVPATVPDPFLNPPRFSSLPNRSLMPITKSAIRYTNEPGTHISTPAAA